MTYLRLPMCSCRNKRKFNMESCYLIKTIDTKNKLMVASVGEGRMGEEEWDIRLPVTE